MASLPSSQQKQGDARGDVTLEKAPPWTRTVTPQQLWLYLVDADPPQQGMELLTPLGLSPVLPLGDSASSGVTFLKILSSVTAHVPRS